LMEETQVFDGLDIASFQTLNQIFYDLDDNGRPIKTWYSNGTVAESAWGCCNKEYNIDTRGIKQSYEYDELDRLSMVIREGVPASGEYPEQPDISTIYTYNGAGRRLEEKRLSNGLTITTSNSYDSLGRLIKSIDAVGLVTQYEYNEKERISKVIYPGGATKITTRHIDGKVKNIKGTGVIAKYYDYGINPDGSTWTKVYAGKENSLQWEKTTSDSLGRSYLTEKPGSNGTIETTQNYYNQRGQLIKTTTTDLADTLYSYNKMGERLRSGFDINGNGTLDPESDDRINESSTQYVHIDESWWDETIQKIYAKKDGSAQTTTQTQRTRMTGFSDTLTAENISISIKGEETLSTVLRKALKITYSFYLDRTKKIRSCSDVVT
ncbi:yD repeat protein, partial [Candidatus Magnetomorum sp. HK-1]